MKALDQLLSYAPASLNTITSWTKTAKEYAQSSIETLDGMRKQVVDYTYENSNAILGSLALLVTAAASYYLLSVVENIGVGAEPINLSCEIQETPTQIDKFYFVNMNGSDKRLDRMQTMCTAAGIACQRFAAVIGKELNIDALINAGIYKPHPKYSSHWLRPSELGCALSHHGVWKDIVETQTQAAVVMEDDVVFSSNFKAEVEDLLKYVPKDWDIMYLGCNAKQKSDFFAPCRPENLKLTPDGRFSILNEKCIAGNWGYVLNSKSAHLLRSNFLPLQRPSDYMISEKFIENGRLRKEFPNLRAIKAYCAVEEPVKTGGAVSMGSVIGNARGKCKDIYCQ